MLVLDCIQVQAGQSSCFQQSQCSDSRNKVLFVLLVRSETQQGPTNGLEPDLDQDWDQGTKDQDQVLVVAKT